MSVGNVDRSTNSSQDQQVKDSYDDREKQLEAKHRRQVAALEAKHHQAVEELKAQYNEEISKFREDTRKAMSNKEKQHIQDVQDVQNANRRRMSQMKMDDDEKFETTKNTLEGEVSRAKTKNQKDTERLTKAFDNENTRRDEEAEDTAVKNREGNQEALHNQAHRFQNQFDTEKKEIREANQAQTERNQLAMAELRRAKDMESGDLKNQLNLQKKTLDGKFTSALDRERSAYEENLHHLEESFQAAIADNKAKFGEKSEALRDEYYKNYGNLRESVQNRVEKEVNSQKRQNEDLRHQSQYDRQQLKQSYEAQKNNIVSEFKRNVDEVEHRRIAAVADSSAQKKHEIEQLHAQNDRAFEMANMMHNAKLNELRASDEKNFNQQIGEVVRERDTNKIYTDNQKKKLANFYSDSILSQAEFHEDQLDAKKRDYEKTLMGQRLTLEKQRVDDVGNVRDMMAKESTVHQEKLFDTIANYEKQMNSLKVDYEKKLRRQAELFREQTDKQTKYLQMDREASDAKMQARLNQMKDTYEKELDQLRKRQAQERQELSTRKI